MSQPQPNHRRTELNNYLQDRYRSADSLSWEYERAGPDHACNWVAIAYIDNVEFGRGTNTRRGTAAEAAAYHALVALRGY